MKHIKNAELELNALLTEKLLGFPDIKLLGPEKPELRGSIVNFTIKGINSEEVADLMNTTNNIMVRAGMHCMHAWFNEHNMPASIRLSLYFYNTEEEIMIFIQTLGKIIKYFK